MRFLDCDSILQIDQPVSENLFAHVIVLWPVLLLLLRRHVGCCPVHRANELQLPLRLLLN